MGGRLVRGIQGLVPSDDSAVMAKARRAWELTRVSVERKGGEREGWGRRARAAGSGRSGLVAKANSKRLGRPSPSGSAEGLAMRGSSREAELKWPLSHEAKSGRMRVPAGLPAHAGEADQLAGRAWSGFQSG
jgi:hypothetical protein